MASGREWYLRSKHKLTLEEYNKIALSQNNKCAICNKDKVGLKRGLAVDHNHADGAIRGLLCVSCNLGLGFFYDQIHLLQNAVSYLKNGNCYYIDEMKEFEPYPDNYVEPLEDCLDIINRSRP